MIHFVGIFTVVCDRFWGLNKFKMVAVAMVTKVQNGRQIQKCCELIFIAGLLWCSELDVYRLRNFRMAAVAKKSLKNLKCSELDET